MASEKTKPGVDNGESKKSDYERKLNNGGRNKYEEDDHLAHWKIVFILKLGAPGDKSGFQNKFQVKSARFGS